MWLSGVFESHAAGGHGCESSFRSWGVSLVPTHVVLFGSESVSALSKTGAAGHRWLLGLQ